MLAVDGELEGAERLQSDKEKNEVAGQDELAEGGDIAGGWHVVSHDKLDRGERKKQSHHSACSSTCPR